MVLAVYVDRGFKHSYLETNLTPLQIRDMLRQGLADMGAHIDLLPGSKTSDQKTGIVIGAVDDHNAVFKRVQAVIGEHSVSLVRAGA